MLEVVKKWDFAKVVDEALRGLPPLVRERISGLPVIVKDKPSRAELEDAGIPPDETLLGLFEGTSIRDKTSEGQPGEIDRIILFRKPLEEMCTTREELIVEIQKTVIHEVGHFLGMREDDMERLGYD